MINVPIYDMVHFLFTFLIASIGCGLILLGLYRKHSDGITLLVIGVFSFGYGLEKTIFSDLTISLYGELSQSFLWVRSFWLPISLLLATLFISRVLDMNWRHPIKWLLMFTYSYVVVSILSDIISGNTFALENISQAITVIWALVILVSLYSSHFRSSEVTILRAGIILSLIPAICDNLVDLSIVPYTIKIGPFGILLLICALGYIALHRFVTTEQELVTIGAEIKAAQEIQNSIIPKTMPKSEHLFIDAKYNPMEGVAGDFYDFLIIDENKIGMFVADVSGHGIGAALIASMVKIATVNQLKHADDPAKVLSGINNSLIGKLSDKYVTACYMFIDVEAKVIKYSGAGHLPILLHQTDKNNVIELEENGLVLGLFPDAEYKNNEIEINGFNTITLYTDGITEAENKDGEMFGIDRFKQLLKDSGKSNSKQVISNVFEKLDSWTDGKIFTEPEDDVTVVVVNCGELSS